MPPVGSAERPTLEKMMVMEKLRQWSSFNVGAGRQSMNFLRVVHSMSGAVNSAAKRISCPEKI